MSYQEAHQALKKDPVLKRYTIPSLNKKPRKSYFDTLVMSIVYQQISGKAAASIYRSLLRKCGTITPDRISRTRSSTLRKVGLSPQKTRYIKDLASHFLRGDIAVHTFSRKSDEEVIEELTRVKGIGLWTAQMFLMFSLGREDVFPTKDLGIQKGYQKLFQKATEEEMLTISEKWKPFRSYVSLMLWQQIEEPGDW